MFSIIYFTTVISHFSSTKELSRVYRAFQAVFHLGTNQAWDSLVSVWWPASSVVLCSVCVGGFLCGAVFQRLSVHRSTCCWRGNSPAPVSSCHWANWILPPWESLHWPLPYVEYSRGHCLAAQSHTYFHGINSYFVYSPSSVYRIVALVKQGKQKKTKQRNKWKDSIKPLY